jgi:hypothetical protein
VRLLRALRSWLWRPQPINPAAQLFTRAWGDPGPKHIGE